MFPKKFAPVLFGLILSGLMTFVVSGLSTYMALNGLNMRVWMVNWATTWAIAFPLILVMAPIARKFVAKITAE